MNSKERVSAVIKGEKFDRIPLYGWVKENLRDEINKAYGTVENFEDHYEFDMSHIFGGPSAWGDTEVYEALKTKGSPLTPQDLLELPMNDANDRDAWKGAKKDIKYHSEDRGRFTYMQTPGIFEACNAYFGIENHLMYMALYPDELKEVYGKQAMFNVTHANNSMDLGVDMIHISDDWGAQRSLIFSPKMLIDMVVPFHKPAIAAAKKRSIFVSMHSDGNINDALQSIVKLGYDVLHPYQISANMDYNVYFNNYSDKFALLGGMDIQATIGFGNLDAIKNEIETVVSRFKDRGILLCTSHYVQDNCSIDELNFVFNTAREAILKAAK